MNHPVHSLVWRDTLYRFQRLRESTTEIGAVEYAVARAGEFIGIMTCPAGLTARDFAAYSFQWLGGRESVSAGR